MNVDFINNTCSQTTNEISFGLCDDEDKWAFVDFDNSEEWISEVENKTQKLVNFVAIDKCLNIQDELGNRKSTCDGLLHYENSLVFVELKTWRKGAWVKVGREQIAKTIELFKTSHDINQYKVKAYVCNKRKPYANQGHAENIERFKDETGYILKTGKLIVVE